MASINKAFVSSPAAPDFNKDQNSPIWRHNQQGKYNTFYGTSHPSIISTSFSQSPSQNKLMKSASIEGTKNLKGAIVGFKTQDQLDKDSTATSGGTLGVVREVNGTSYLPVGKSQEMVFGKGFQVLGKIDTSVAPVTPSGPVAAGKKEYVSVKVDPGYVNNTLLFDEARPAYYAIVQIGETGGVGAVAGKTLSVNPGNNLSDFQITTSDVISTSYTKIVNNTNGTITGTNQPEGSGVLDFNPVTTSFNVSIDGALSEAMAVAMNDYLVTNGSPFLSGSDFYLAAFYHEDFAGDFLRGQTAEATIMVPYSAGYFEIYALNLNYEPLPLSHDK
jgi:hypothetical protein